MQTQHPEPPKPKRALSTFGGVSILAGGLVIGAIVLIAYARPDLGYKIGLAGMVSSAAIAQVMILVGGWLVWRALRDR